MSNSNAESRITQGIGYKPIPAKRLYRGVLDYVKRLENGRQHRRNAISLFVAEQVGLRIKLRDACEKLLFTYPLEYGKKAEELIWRKVYYEVIQLIKRNKRFEKPDKALNAYYQQLLYSGIGYYHHLLLKLQAYFDVNTRIDWPFTVSSLSNKSKRRLHSTIKANDESIDYDDSKQIQEFAKHMCYRFFMCLGDLGRYQLDLGASQTFAERFYQLAASWKPRAGMPYNQLGTLAGHGQCWGLNAAYYYYKCLETESKFEGAEANLQKLLDRNKKTFYHIPTDALEMVANTSTDDYRKNDSRTFIVSFLYLCDLLRPKTYATDVEITGLCKKIIDAFSTCLNSMLKSDLCDGNSILHHNFMQPSIVYKMTVICIINIHNLQTSRSNRSSAAVAFTLAYLSHLLGFLASVLTKDAVVNTQNQNGAGDGVNQSTVEKSQHNQVKTPSEDGDAGKDRKKSRKHLRRRRNRDLDVDLSEGEDDPDQTVSSSDTSTLSSEDDATSDSDFSQEELPDDKADKPSPSSPVVMEMQDSSQLELATSISNGNNTLESLKDISQKMFQPVRRHIQLAPSFLNKPQIVKVESDDEPKVEVEAKPMPIPATDATDSEENKDKDIEKEEDTLEEENNDNVDDSSSKLENFKKLEKLGYLTQSLKLLCDWLASNKQVTEACAQNSQVLWHRIAKLANLMPNEDLLATFNDDVINDQISKMDEKEWNQVMFLPEDSVTKAFDENTNMCLDLTQQAAIRILCFRHLSRSLTQFDDLELHYDEETKMFSGPLEEDEEVEGRQQLQIEAVDEMRKNKLMKDMAALRLKTEVNALEISLGSSKSHMANMCLYLVPDTLALCYELQKIKRLVNSKRFFLVIPKVVIDGLDALKKDLQGARDAARYLETEFKKGNRFLRAQMAHESKAGVQGERPKLRKNDMQAWRFYRIIECCLHLVEKEQKNSTDDSQAAGMVAILTRSTDRSVMSLNQINAISSAQTLGIQIQAVAEFVKNWKKT